MYTLAAISVTVAVFLAVKVLGYMRRMLPGSGRRTPHQASLHSGCPTCPQLPIMQLSPIACLRSDMASAITARLCHLKSWHWFAVMSHGNSMP